MKPKAQIETRYEQARVPFEHVNNRFEVNFGYKHHCDVQLRLNEDGTVSAFHQDETSWPDKCVAAINVEFGVFQELFREFVRTLAARSASGPKQGEGGES